MSWCWFKSDNKPSNVMKFFPVLCNFLCTQDWNCWYMVLKASEVTRLCVACCNPFFSLCAHLIMSCNSKWVLLPSSLVLQTGDRWCLRFLFDILVDIGLSRVGEHWLSLLKSILSEKNHLTGPVKLTLEVWIAQSSVPLVRLPHRTRPSKREYFFFCYNCWFSFFVLE